MLEPFDFILNHDLHQLSTYLEYGNVNVQDEYGRSLLCFAIKIHQNDAVELLLKHFIDVNLKDQDGNTCYHYAVYHNRLGYLKTLLKIEGNAMDKNNEGQTPLYLACRYGRVKMVDLYLESYSLDVKEEDNNQETMLMAMVRSGNLRLLNRFFDYELLEHENIDGETMLVMAARLNHVQMVSYLLDKKAFVHQKDHYHQTALYYAFLNQNREMILLLAAAGSCFDIHNKFHVDLSSLAKEPWMKELLVELQANKKRKEYAKNYPLQYALLTEDEAYFMSHLTMSYLEKKDEEGFTPLVLAEKLGNQKLKELLLKEIKNIKIYELKHRK